jgi:tripartite-type tricarboxylate transporter receptor subunit TctC
MTILPMLDRRHLLALALASGAGTLHAQLGGRPVSFIVPQPAGNPSDGMARKVQPLLQKELGATVVVENLPGAGGSIGLAKALAPAQGTQALMIASQTEPILTPLAWASVRYRPEDFRCVGLLGRCPYVLIGRPDLPARTHAELLALGRGAGAKPLSYGHIGAGSMIHLLGAEWSRLARVPLTHVPYKGVPPAVQDLMGGQIDLTFAPLAGTIPSLLESGKVRVYGSTAAAPTARVPALARLDPTLAGFVHGTWGAVFVPASAPADFTARVHKALAEALQDAEVLAYLDGTGMERPAPQTLAQLEAFYRTETALYQRMAREIGIERQ